MAENLQGSALVIVVLSASLSTLVVLLRFFSRWLGRNFGHDDTLIAIAVVFNICHTALTYAYVKYTYLGYHMRDIPLMIIIDPHYQARNSRINAARTLFYGAIFGFARASVIVFLLRLEEYRKRIRRWLQALLILNFMVMAGVLMTEFFGCKPIHYLWDYPLMTTFDGANWVFHGTCLNLSKLGIAQSSMTIILDVFVLITPMIMVWKLRMSKSSKIIAVLVLSVGWLAVIASIGQMIFFLSTMKPSHFDPNSDGTYNIGWTLSNAEVNVAIIAASVPALKALFKRVCPRTYAPQSPVRHDPPTNLSDLTTWGTTEAALDDMVNQAAQDQGAGQPRPGGLYTEGNVFSIKKAARHTCCRTVESADVTATTTTTATDPTSAKSKETIGIVDLEK